MIHPEDINRFWDIVKEWKASSSKEACVAKETALLELRGLSYDLVCNGVELGGKQRLTCCDVYSDALVISIGGSIRIHESSLQREIFCTCLGHSDEFIDATFQVRCSSNKAVLCSVT